MSDRGTVALVAPARRDHVGCCAPYNMTSSPSPLDLQKLDLSTVILSEELKSGSFLIDGVLNSSFLKCGRGGTCDRFDTVVGASTTPASNEGGVRHSIAVSGNRIMEAEFSMSADALWLSDSSNAPDRRNGYFYKIFKVYRIRRCLAPGSGCKGACGRAKRQKRG